LLKDCSTLYMKRILMCSHQFSVGGISRVVHALREALTRLGYSVEMMAPSYSIGEEVDIPIPSLNMPGLLGSLSFWELATRIAERRKDRYDLIMMHHPVLVSGKPLNLGKKAVVTFHGTYYGYARAYRLYKLGRRGPYYDLATRIERRMLNRLSSNQGNRLVVTGVSPSTISELRANGYDGIAHFVPNAIPHISEIVSKKRARDLLDSLSHQRISQDDKVLLYVGSSKNVASKRPQLVPPFFREITKYNSQIKLVMVGVSSSFRRLEELAREFNDIFYLGSVPHDHLHLLYSAADAYISLSCYEGLPNSALEAAAHRLPLILSDIPAHRWIISNGIGHGILVDSFDPVDDADKVSTVFESLDDSQCYYNSSIQTEFSWDQSAKSYLRFAEIC